MKTYIVTLSREDLVQIEYRADARVTAASEEEARKLALELADADDLEWSTENEKYIDSADEVRNIVIED